MRSTSASAWFAIAVVLIGLSYVFPNRMVAQAGGNAVCASTTGCTNADSAAYIDAAVFAGNVNSPDFCSVVNYVLVHQIQPNYPAGAVIDARGLPWCQTTTNRCQRSQRWRIMSCINGFAIQPQ